MFGLMRKPENTQSREPQAASVTQHSMGDDLRFIQGHGKNSLRNYGSGWSCSCDIENKTAGVNLEVRTDFGLSTPEEAAAQCADRLRVALRAIGVAP